MYQPHFGGQEQIHERSCQSQVLDLGPLPGRQEPEPSRSVIALLLQIAPHWRRDGQLEHRSFLEIQKVGLLLVSSPFFESFYSSSLRTGCPVMRPSKLRAGN